MGVDFAALAPKLATPIGDALRQHVAETFDMVPEGKSVAFFVHGDLKGNATVDMAFKAGDCWTFRASAGINLKERVPVGSFTIVGCL